MKIGQLADTRSRRLVPSTCAAGAIFRRSALLWGFSGRNWGLCRPDSANLLRAAQKPWVSRSLTICD